MKDRPTSFDIAHLAGVSQSTVSRALNNSALVNKETRDKVQRIARELNYKVDKNASNLRTQQSRTLALLLFEDPTSDNSMINPFYSAMLGSITRACAKNGYDLLVSFQDLDDDWHAEYEDSNKADGIILLGYGDFLAYQTKLRQLINQGTHLVRWGAPVADYPGISIGCDNYQGGYDITNHLIKNGYSQFSFIGDAGNNAPEFQARYLGFIQAIKDNFGDISNVHQFDAISTDDAGYTATKQLLAKQIDCNALVCACDIIAIGVLRALQEANCQVPQDYAVVGFDNIQLSAFTSPALTTIDQNTQLAGELLVSNLLKAIRNQETTDSLMQAELVVRKSCQRIQ